MIRLLTLLIWTLCTLTLKADDRPNILWITSEDNGCYLGCYGDEIARTPNLDALAKESTRYLNCFSNAAVCAPARQTLITGMYASSIGGQHMRSKVEYPPSVTYFPSYLKAAGYYTSNRSKTDYNGAPSNGREAMNEAWDQSSNKGHWRNRPKPETPFFSVFNIGSSHESNLFPSKWKKKGEKTKTDPATVKLPTYLPDLPEIRTDLARYYDRLETMDQEVGEILAQLEEDGLADQTIVFYFSDHGGSMPRGKSFTYDSGTHVPLLVRIPEQWKSYRPTPDGETTDRLVSFVDFAPTMLNLAKIAPLNYMQGTPFLGEATEKSRKFVHTFRGRRGERYDIVRGVRNKNYLYLRNYTPHLPVLQYNAYSFGIPGYQAWKDAYENGTCDKIQAQWFDPKQSEELYYINDDPDNTINLASDSEHQTALTELRSENDRHIEEVRDSVFYPEGMEGREYSAYQSDDTYPVKKLIALGSAVSNRNPANLPLFQKALQDENACIRYQGVMGCLILGEKSKPAADLLHQTATDQKEDGLIRIQAARALAGMGETEKALPTIRHFLEHAKNDQLALRTVLAIDECQLLESAPTLGPLLKSARGSYTQRVTDKLLNP